MEKSKGALPGMRPSLLAQSNLKTPTRQRFSVAQTSESKKENRFSLSGINGGNGSRRLSMFKAPSVAPRVDTSEKMKQQGYIRKIVEFITDLEGEGIATPANVARPTMSEFVTFVNVIYADLSPDYTLMDKKLVEETPRFFNALGYPYPIKHSYLQPIGAAHNWHYLLHALCWLIDLNKLVENLQSYSSIILNDGNTDRNTATIRYSWFISTFGEHLTYHGDESVTKGATSRLKDFFEDQENYSERIEIMMNELHNLKEENNEYDNEEGGLDLELRNLTADVQKAQDSAEIHKHECRNIERTKDSVVLAVTEMRSELTELSKLLQQKKEEVLLLERKTGFKSEDVFCMKTELETNRQIHKQLMEEHNRCEVEIWSRQSEYAHGFTQLLARVTDFIYKVNEFQSKNLGMMDGINCAFNNLEELQRFVTKELRHIITKILIAIDGVKNRTISDIESLRSQIRTFETELQVGNERVLDVRRILKQMQIDKERCIEERAKERQYIYTKIDEIENDREAYENVFRMTTGVCLKLDDSFKELERLREDTRVHILTLEDTVITNTQRVTSVLEAQQEVTNICEGMMWDICEYFDQIMKILSHEETS